MIDLSSFISVLAARFNSFKFGVKYKGKEKMRNDYWAEYEDDFPYQTMADVDYFNATIDGYDAGEKPLIFLF